MFVVPEVDVTIFPLRSSTVRMFDGLADDARSGKEVRNRERDFLLPGDVVGRRAAFEVDRSVRHQRNAVRRRYELILHVEFRQLEVGANGVDDAQAQIHRIADRLLLVVVVGEGQGRIAMADSDRAGVLDLLERAGLLRPGRSGERQKGDRERERTEAVHGVS